MRAGETTTLGRTVLVTEDPAIAASIPVFCQRMPPRAATVATEDIPYGWNVPFSVGIRMGGALIALTAVSDGAAAC